MSEESQLGSSSHVDVPHGTKRKAEEEDIDDEEEFLLAQAMATRDTEGDQPVIEQERLAICDPQLLLERGIKSMFSTRKATRTQATPAQGIPHDQAVRAAPSPIANLPGPGASTASGAVPLVVGAMGGQQQPPVPGAPAEECRWGIRSIDPQSLKLSSESCRLLQAPEKLNKTYKSKWIVEAAKLKTAGTHIEGMLCNGKVKDQEVKTCVTALKRLGNEKTDKKLGCEKMEEQHRFSHRTSCIREILVQYKDLRTVVMVSR